MSKIARLQIPRIAMPNTGGNPNTGMRGFFVWLRDKQPRIYSAAMRRVPEAGLSGLGIDSPDTTSSGPAPTSLADKIKDIVFGVSQAYLTSQQLKAQKEVLDTQLQRAKMGLAPLNIDMAQYGLTGPSVSVGMSPQTQTLLIYGAVGLAAVYLLPKLLKR